MPKFVPSSISDALPDAFWHGVTQFNRGAYYDCHDTLEAIWMEAPQVQKPFYQGILQIAVGLYHLGNCNWRGAAILLGEGSHRLYAYEPSYGDIDVTGLIDQANHWLSLLQERGPEQVETLAASLRSPSPPTDDSGPAVLMANTVLSKDSETTFTETARPKLPSIPQPPKIKTVSKSLDQPPD